MSSQQQMDSAREANNGREPAHGGREQNRIDAYIKRQKEVAFAEGNNDYGDEYGDDDRGNYREEQAEQSIEWPTANQRQNNYDEDAEDVGWPS